jgi:hypothetical protein
MTWIHFGSDEQPVALPLLWDADGRPVRLGAQSSDSLVLLLCPDAVGTGCAHALWQLGQQIDAVTGEDAFAYAVFPGDAVDVLPHAPLPSLQDRGGVFRSVLAGLLEFDTGGQPLLFLFDETGKPVGAWVGPATPSDDLGRGTVERLRRAALRCPE